MVKNEEDVKLKVHNGFKRPPDRTQTQKFKSLVFSNHIRKVVPITPYTIPILHWITV